MEFDIRIKSWNDLTIQELYAMIQLRELVFVVEQKCAYLDADGKDLYAHHAMWVENDTCLACARILPPGISYDEWSIGRLVTHSSVRRSGHGKGIMRAVMQWLKNHGAKKIRISAQSYLLDFYESFGFEIVGEEYLEDGIPHIEMIFTPQ